MQHRSGPQTNLLRSVCLTLAGFGAAAIFAVPASAAQQDDPLPSEAEAKLNVLVLIADDLAAGALSAYGNRQVKTPAIDSLAARGLRFDNAYCQYPICGPSRVALLSGMYPRSSGVLTNGQATKWARRGDLPPTLPQLFRRSGWQTTRISKVFHMRVPGDITAGVDGGDHPASWDQRFNCQAPEWRTPGASQHLSQEALEHHPTKHNYLGFGTAFYVIEGEGDGTEQADHQAASRAIEVLRAKREQPFFLAVGFVRPHVPLVAPKAYFDPYPAAGLQLPEAVEGDRDDIPELGHSRSSEDSDLTDPDKQRQVLRGYYASVSYLDAQVARILAALEQTDQADNTLVIFTSDHGYHLGEHDFWQKMSLHEEVARIPLIVAGPGVAQGVTPGLAQQIDLYPTLAELAGIEAPDHLQGKSLAPMLRDPSLQVHEQVYCGKRRGHLLRTQRYAFLQWEDESCELYDMQLDPLQFQNRAGDPELAEVEADLAGRLAKVLASFGEADSSD